MTRQTLSRLRRMDSRELAWRTRAALRIVFERTRSSIVPPRWDRRDLLSRLRPVPALAGARAALRERRWDEAHRLLSSYFAARPPRFAIAPALRDALRERVTREHPEAASDAAARADRLLAGEYDLLGYRGLRFDRGHQLSTPEDTGEELFSPPVDWHFDPVHGCRVPRAFWADVPYLDPACGDHKVIWELNRHQHWLALGRGYWLTGDRRYRNRCLSELASWLDANPPLIGGNWASMLELALRSISWIWALNFFAEGRAPAEAGHYASSATAGDGARSSDAMPWTVDLLLALDRQLTHVERNLSYYFSPNTHLLGEALALYVAGRALPELARAARWEAIGRRILVDQIDRQIERDGGHAERSTHYHRYTLDFYLLALTVARITGDSAAPVFARAVDALASAARLFADDRGRVAHIGDDDGGAMMPIAGRAADDWRDSLTVAAALLGHPELRVGPAPEEPAWLLAEPALASRLDALRDAPVAAAIASAALPHTGYYVSRSPAGDHLIVDGGPHGYQNGGHAHADALSLAFTLRGVPLLIDAGTGCYTIDPALRDRLRSTSLHNTLRLDGRDQSIPRGPFHWTTIANSTVRRWRANGSFDYFEGAHDGYRPLEHRRHVLALHGDLLLVADLVSGPAADAATHSAAVHWHVDPGWWVELTASGAQLIDGNRVSLHTPHGTVERFDADAVSGLGWHAPVYGRIEPATTIRITHAGAAPFWVVSVFGLDAANPVSGVATLPVWAEAGVLARSTAVRITRGRSIDYWVLAEPAPDAASDLEVETPHAGAGLCVGPVRTWRIAEFETDARMLFCRVGEEQQVTRLALVDGSILHSSARQGVTLALPQPVPDLHLDAHGIRTSGGFDRAEAHGAGPSFGATFTLGGIERPSAG
jgi:hypothetical protein